MVTLQASKRDPQTKAKKLRREGFVTGVLYGRDMKETMPLQFAEADAMRFIKSNKEGTQVLLNIGGEQTNALVKNVDFDPLKKQINALDFQALVAGEVVSASVQIIFENTEGVQGIVEQELSEIHYKADPANLLDTVVIDFSKFPQETRDFYVKDLKLTEGRNIHLTTPEDALIFHIADYAKADDEETEETAEA